MVPRRLLPIFCLACLELVCIHCLPVQGPGVQWVGINGGHTEDYTDKGGRVWYKSQQQWSPNGWGGWNTDVPPRTYTNDWGKQCRNWPPEYDQDRDALLQHYTMESGSGDPLSFRVNLQNESGDVSYYTVKWLFCEKNLHGGAPMDFWINGMKVEESYTSKHHHTHTDIYHWRCIPTVKGTIELRIQGKDWEKASQQGIQARFSTLEFEKSLGGCEACDGVSCGKGICSASKFWDQSGWSMGDKGDSTNDFDTETPAETPGACHCGEGISGTSCESGTCAAVVCNEPFGGTCTEEGVCSCINGHTGAQCMTKPDLDEFGCYARSDVAQGKLHVSTLCLPELIAGPTVNGHIFRGPAPMNTVADRAEAGTVYFSWTSDRRWGNPSNAGTEGRIYISKVVLQDGKLPVLSASTPFDGFVRAGGIDMTEDGYVGTLCAKWFPSWYDAFAQDKSYSPMVLAVCEAKVSDMTARGVPWRIGKQFQDEDCGGAQSCGGWGNYPLKSWYDQRSAGYGRLQYSPHNRTWVAWYGATVGTHTGYAMHAYSADAANVSDEVYSKYVHPVPRDQVESRQESFGAFSGGGREGTGDHQAGSAWRYHPLLHDIGLQKHNHGYVYMQQYGLVTPAGKFAPPGHGSGRVEMTKDGKSAILEGGIRPCGDGWIMGLIEGEGGDYRGPEDKRGNVCAKVNSTGDITVWKTIERSVGKMVCAENGGHCGDGAPGRMVRIAPLGSKESEALCGSDARFLFGYEKLDRTRWLVEVDGDCNEIADTRQDVTAHTHWSLYQDWTTTEDGAVAWVTTWHDDAAAKFGPKGSPNGAWPYQPQPADATDGYMFGLTPDATNQAKLTVYYPEAREAPVDDDTGSQDDEASGAHATTSLWWMLLSGAIVECIRD